jgi:hypothetical protein
MSVKGKYIITGIIILFVALILLVHYRPKQVSWELNCNSGSKAPYGCMVVRQMLPYLFPGEKIRDSRMSFFQLLNSGSVKGNLIVITQKFDPSATDLNILLNYVSEGNDLFVSALDFSEGFGDTIGFKSNRFFFDTLEFSSKTRITDSAFNGRRWLNFTKENLSRDTGYTFSKTLHKKYFIEFDSSRTEVLGIDYVGRSNFIAVNFKKGRIFLHCQPLVFTNFHLLYSNSDYACAALSYLPERSTVWDEYYKPFKFTDTSPVRYILSEPALRMGYYITLFSIVFYLIVGSRRKQRRIPVVQSPRNESLRFIYTLGRLYFNKHNNADLVKKITLFLNDFIRRRYMINVNDTDFSVLAVKSGIQEEELKALFSKAGYLSGKDSVDNGSLTELFKMAENFYKRCS